MNDYPIKTIEKDNVIVKLCTENVNKLRSRCINIAMESTNKIIEMFNRWFDLETGDFLINSRGVAKCNEDEFDSKIGKEIAFRKVKLSANIKKLHMVDGALREQLKGASQLLEIRNKLLKYVDKDIDALKEYNPSYCPRLS